MHPLPPISRDSDQGWQNYCQYVLDRIKLSKALDDEHFSIIFSNSSFEEIVENLLCRLPDGWSRNQFKSDWTYSQKLILLRVGNILSKTMYENLDLIRKERNAAAHAPKFELNWDRLCNLKFEPIDQAHAFYPGGPSNDDLEKYRSQLEEDNKRSFVAALAARDFPKIVWDILNRFTCSPNHQALSHAFSGFEPKVLPENWKEKYEDLLVYLSENGQIK